MKGVEIMEKDILVICRNCGEIERYNEEYMTPLRKNWHNCSKCGNRTHDYHTNRRWANEMIKKGSQEVKIAIEEDKYNEKIFGRHKGFEYKKVNK